MTNINYSTQQSVSLPSPTRSIGGATHLAPKHVIILGPVHCVAVLYPRQSKSWCLFNSEQSKPSIHIVHGGRECTVIVVMIIVISIALSSLGAWCLLCISLPILWCGVVWLSHLHLVLQDGPDLVAVAVRKHSRHLVVSVSGDGTVIFPRAPNLWSLDFVSRHQPWSGQQ